jgi:mono/diheme cytochrome c family protein
MLVSALLMLILASPAVAQTSQPAKKKAAEAAAQQSIEQETRKLTEETRKIKEESRNIRLSILAEKHKIALVASLQSATARRLGGASETAEIKDTVNPRTGAISSAFLFKGLRGAWTVSEIHLSVILNNVSKTDVRVNWDEATFVDPDSHTHRVIHSGVPIIARNAAQLPTPIAADSDLEDELFPSDYLDWSGSEWMRKQLLTGREGIDKPVGKTVRVTIPISSRDNGATIDYTFVFTIRVPAPAIAAYGYELPRDEVATPLAAFGGGAATFFKARCAPCHGPDGRGQPQAPDVTGLAPEQAVELVDIYVTVGDLSSEKVQNLSDEQIAKVVTEGKWKMPATDLSEGDLKNLIAFLRTLKKP